MSPSILIALLLTPLASAAEPDSVTMNLSQFLQLYEQTKTRPDKPEKAPREFALASASYNGEVIFEDGEPVSAVIKARLTVDVLKAKGWVRVRLLPATVAVQEARIGGKTAPLTLENGYYTLVTDAKGPQQIDITFAVAVDTSAGSSGFGFQLVPSGATELTLSVPSKDDLDFTIANARLKTDRVVGNRRVVEATLPATGSLQVRWQREIPEAEQAQEARIYSEVSTLVGVGEGLLHARATIQNTILFAGVDELKAKIPDGMTLLDVTGNGLRDWTLSDDGTVTAMLNYAAEGNYVLTLDMERVLDSTTVSAPLVIPLGVERSKGWVGVEAVGTVEVGSGEVKGATPVDVRTLPASILGTTTNPVLLGYKYLGDDAQVPLVVEEHDEVDVLVTLLDQADATTMFTQDGRRLTRVQYDVRNNRRQFLRLTLPSGAELWSAAVAGRAVQPAQGADGRLLVPLVRSQAATGGALAAFPVEVVYVESGQGPASNGKGTFEAKLPKADVPTTYVAWTVYAPNKAKVKAKSKKGSLRDVDYLSRPLGASQALAIEAYNAPMQQRAAGQADTGSLGQGAAPVKVNLPLDGQAIFFEKLLALDEDLWVRFNYSKLK